MSAPARNGKAPALAVAGVLASLCTLSSPAQAHRIGLSQGEYTVSNEHVESRLVFAASELKATPTLDASKIAERVVITRGAEACRSSLESVAPTAEDGIMLVVRHDCESNAGDLRADLRFLNELEKGHRHIARISGITGQSEIVAYAGNSRLSLGSAAPSKSHSSARDYVRLGIEHILGGADHLLFLLGVALLPATLRSLLLSVTAFTVSHSLTLALATLGIVRVNPASVEPLIALSVAYVAVENWFAKDARRRWRLTFAFGLVHGLGFAGALRDVGIPQDRVPVALACFNIGVELGQLLVVLALWVVVSRIQWRSWYRPRVLATASIGLFVAGAFWSVERTGLFTPRASALKEAKAASAHKNDSTKGEKAALSNGTGTPPMVARLCQSLSELPRARRAECSHTRPGISLTNQCTRMLAASVSSGAVSLVEPEADKCLAEWNQRYEGCDFLERASLPQPAACAHVFVGNLGLESVCRSSLECGAGLICDGAGPTESGHCRPPHDKGASCGLSVDPLLAYVQGAAADRQECLGACVNNRCTGS